MKVENISKLVQDKLKTLQSFGYFEAEAKSLEAKNILKQQTGVIRTNCIDNLDRTNVVQSTFGRIFIKQCLQTLGYPELLDISPFKNSLLEESYRHIWTNNANRLAKLYTSSDA